MSQGEHPSISPIEILKARQSYAWNWFDFHAKQRTTIINYFIIAAGLIANAYATVLKESKWGGVIVGLSGCVLSFVFYFLERRNAQMVGWGERVLRQSEAEFLFLADTPACGEPELTGILRWEKAAIRDSLTDDSNEGYFARGGHWKYKVFGWVPMRVEHGFWLPIFIGIIGLMFLLLAGIALFHPIGTQPVLVEPVPVGAASLPSPAPNPPPSQSRD